MKSADRVKRLKQLVELSRRIGNAVEGFAILGEGNTSTRSGENTFWVKASGTSLSTAEKESFTECRRPVLDSLWESSVRSDSQVDEKLLESRVKSKDRSPPPRHCFTPTCSPYQGSSGWPTLIRLR